MIPNRQKPDNDPTGSLHRRIFREISAGSVLEWGDLDAEITEAGEAWDYGTQVNVRVQCRRPIYATLHYQSTLSRPCRAYEKPDAAHQHTICKLWVRGSRRGAEVGDDGADGGQLVCGGANQRKKRRRVHVLRRLAKEGCQGLGARIRMVPGVWGVSTRQ